MDYEKPLDKKLSNKEVREWYIEHNNKIPDLIDTTKPLKEQAKQAFELREKYKQQARNMMADRESAEYLENNEPKRTFDELFQEKNKKYGMTENEIYIDIIRSSQTTRKSINEKFNL